MHSAVAPRLVFQGLSQPHSRVLFSSGKKCRFDCVFCFARFDEYSRIEAQFETVTIDDAVVVYPTCDAEFAQDLPAQARLNKLIVADGPPLFVSISTRARLSGRLLADVSRWNACLRVGRGGFVKLSVSFSAKDSQLSMEPKASAYAARLQTLAMLAAEGIPTSVNLKPLLPDVPSQEYEAIVEDTRPFTNSFLLGGLYVDPKSDYGRRILSTYKSFASERIVNWLPEKPSWPYLEDRELVKHLTRVIESLGARVFHDDLALMRFIGASR